MLQLFKTLGTMSLLAAVLIVGAQRGSAKCMSLEIILDGEIAGPTKGLTVRVEVPSKTKGDPVTDVSQTYSSAGAHFHVVAWFNTTSNVIRKETCDRKPWHVIVKLMNGEQVLDQQILPIETAFRKGKDGSFNLIEPVILHAVKAK